MSSCPVEISDKGIVRNLLERKRNGYKEALDLFKSYIPAEANAVLGLQVSTAVQSFDNETFIYITFAGTPVILEFDEE